MASGARDVVLVTRPEPGLSETMAQVEALGWRAVACPAIVIEPCPLSAPGAAHDAIVVTSGQAIPALVGCLSPEVALFAVGEGTARRARAAGFLNVRAAGGDAEALAGFLGAPAPGHDRALLPTGAGAGLALASRLRGAGWHVTRRVVYRARSLRGLPPDAREMMVCGRVRTILFYSAVTARAFRAGVPNALVERLRDIRAITLSPAVAAVLDPSEWGGISVADHPGQEAILACLQELGSAGKYLA